MAEFYIDGDKCKSFEIAIKKAAQQLKESQTAYVNVQFDHCASISLFAKRVGDRVDFDHTFAALIFDELLTEAFLNSKRSV